MTKKLISTLRNRTSDNRPAWMMRQAGRYLPEYRKTREQAGSFLDLCYTPKLAEEVTLQPLRRFEFDAAIVFADILLVPHALGQDVSFREGEGPVLDPVTSIGAVNALSQGKLDAHLAPIYETLDRLSSSLPSDVTLIGFCGAPWTVATYMIEGGTSRDRKSARTAAWAALNDQDHWFSVLMDMLVASSARYLIGQVKAGAEVLQIFETWALDLPPSLFERFCVQPIAEIVRQVKSVHPEVPIICFPRGTSATASMFCDHVGCAGYGCDAGADLSLLEAPETRSFVTQGNLDPICLLHGGDALDAEVEKIVRQTRPGHHIFNLGHGILPETPIENVDQMLSALRTAERNVE